MQPDHPLMHPLTFRPAYMNVVWGGRRLEHWRDDLPEGAVGESWELADHERGMSVIANGPLAGTPLDQVMAEHGRAIVGATWQGGAFPLLIKIIDAQDRLSVQVHPDDQLVQAMGVGNNGKTECWLMLADGGQLYQGTKPGVNRAAFEQALRDDQVADTLNCFDVNNGDFFFLPARTVHALGTGCLLLEVQQNCDITFRVYDWGRVGLDGKPRPLHVDESLQTIDFSSSRHGPVQAPSSDHPEGGSVRHLVNCPYFSVEERITQHTRGGGGGSCSVITNLHGQGTLATAAGSIDLKPMRTYLISACAGPWSITGANDQALRCAIATPH